MSSYHIQSQDQDFLVMCFPLSSGSKAAFYEFGSLWLKDKFNHCHQHPQHPQDPVTKGQQRHCTMSPSWQGGEGRTTRNSSTCTQWPAGRQPSRAVNLGQQGQLQGHPCLGISMTTSEASVGGDSPSGRLLQWPFPLSIIAGPGTLSGVYTITDHCSPSLGSSGNTISPQS